MSEDRQKIQLGYHFVHQEDLVAMGRALHKEFDVQLESMPGNVGNVLYATAFIEIALGVLAAGVGTFALKRVVELITEDLYNCAKDFAKAYIHHRRACRFGSPTTQLQLTFELDDVFFGAIIDSNDEEDIVLALQDTKSFIGLCDLLLTSKSLPQDVVLNEIKATRDDTSKTEPKILNSNCTLPDLDSVVFAFDTELKQWNLVRLTTADGEYYKLMSNHMFLWGQFIRELDRWQKRRDEMISNKNIQPVSVYPILFLAADPTDTSRLRLGEELREIQEKLQLANLREKFQLHQRMSVRPADISQALLDIQPQIVHFSGHGTTTGALCFENQVGQTHPIQPDAIAALFEQFSNQVNCVVLNACYSEIQANAIAKHIDYVIGMNQAIGDKAAIAFAIGFYQALGAGRTIEEAYKLGCVQIGLQGIPEHLTPVFIKKGAVQP